MNDYADLIWRLENGADRFLKWTYNEPYSGAPVISIPRHPDNIDALLTEAAACIREMVEIVAGFVSAEDDAKSNPMGGLSLGGLMDGRDNSGCVYQSASLAALIERARALPLPPAPGAEDE